jgi:hypothetical protein
MRPLPPKLPCISLPWLAALVVALTTWLAFRVFLP